MTESVLRRFSFRSPRLYDSIVELLGEAGEEGIRWVELLARADPDDEWAERTVEGAIRDLVVLGAAAVGGQRGGRQRPESRRVWLTPLGEAAIAGRLAGLPWRAEA